MTVGSGLRKSAQRRHAADDLRSHMMGIADRLVTWMYRQRWEYVPLRVEVRLRSPVMLTHPWLHFDSLLVHLMHYRAMGGGYWDIWDPHVTLGPYLREVCRIRGIRRQRRPYLDYQGLPHASVSIWEPRSPRPRSETYVSKFEGVTAPLRSRKKKIRLGFGYYRSYLIKQVVVAVRSATFYTCSDEGLVRGLLREELKGLGDNVRIGYGEVAGVDVERIGECRCFEHGGVAMRQLPVELLDEYSDIAFLPWKSPYWSADHIVRCAVPQSEISLGNGLVNHLARRRGNG